MSLGIAELLGHAKVDRVQHIALSATAHEEIVWLDIAMQKAFAVYVLNSRDGLFGYQEDGLQRETSAAVVEQVLERRAEEVVDQHMAANAYIGRTAPTSGISAS